MPPAVGGVGACGAFEIVALDIAQETPIIGVGIELAAVASADQGAFFGAGTGPEAQSLAVAGVAGEDIDHAVDRVGAP